MEIVTLAYNRPDFLELQLKSLKRWVPNFNFTVFDNCPDNRIKNECIRLGIKCIPIKIFSPDPSWCVGLSLNKMWETLKYTKGTLVYLDSDMFLVGKLPDMKDYDFAFVPQIRPKNILYPWTGLMLFNMDTLPYPERLKWEVAPQIGADVGGLNHFYLQENKVKVLELEMFTLIDDGKYSYNGADAGEDKSRGKLNGIMFEFDFPRPYSFDIFSCKGWIFVFHYKSASNYPAFYTPEYNRLKTKALCKLLMS